MVKLRSNLHIYTNFGWTWARNTVGHLYFASAKTVMNRRFVRDFDKYMYYFFSRNTGKNKTMIVKYLCTHAERDDTQSSK